MTTTKTTKTRRGRFTPWCHEAERDEYNDESRRGWHLTKRTLRDMTYEYDPDVEYRYAIDYRLGHDEGRYLELFRDDGWEPVGAVVDGFKSDQPGKNKFISEQDGCWYIFRKEYDPARPGIEYEIATDEESLREFRRTLKRTYTRRLILEIFFFLIYSIINAIFSIWNVMDCIILIGAGLAILSAGYRLLCLNVFRPRKPLRLFIDFDRAATTVCIVYFLFFLVYFFVTAYEPPVSITAENTPVNLFLALEPDTTYQDVEAMGRTYGWDTSVTSRLMDGDEVQVYYVEIALNRDRLFYEDEVELQLCFSPADNELDAAMLTINTRHGSAYCVYMPHTEGADPYTLTLQPTWRDSATYSPDTAREAIDLAYSVVYPEGLE